jgi:hypothetical protein
MYRERHAFECETNNHALLARPIDDQVGRLFGALTILEDWRGRIAAAAAKRGPRRIDVASLDEQKRRLGKAFANGAFTDGEYEQKLAEIERRRRLAQPVASIRVEECVALLNDLPALWAEATLEERGRLIAPLVERAWIDVRSKSLCAITPAEGFDDLLNAAVAQADGSDCLLLPAEVANQPDWWTWWRRGRIELPVQRPDALSLLQAYPDS